jgi:hypothetical protein
MRGDSLQDLYAKTLALIGLGLLAGIGALVDYWPVAAGVPSVPVAAALDRPDVPVPMDAADAQMPDFPARWRANAPRMARAATPPAAEASARAADASAAAPPLDALRAADPQAVPAVAPRVTAVLDAPPPPEPIPALFDADPVPTHGFPLVELALAAGTTSLPVSREAPSGLPPLALSDAAELDDSDGFLSDAGAIAKKAGSSIVTGTMKAGAPFVGMARLLGGAFKKITPFKDDK